MICAVRLGTIWRQTIFKRLWPIARAAATKSCSFSANVCARTIRATPVHENIASISTSVSMLAGTNAKTMMISSRLGTDCTMSTRRISAASVLPPA